jgi:ABC-2 type transport system ATP-binding protein
VPEPIISARSLSRKFGDFTAVDDLTLEVEPGAIFAFLGANGSGKSTTIRMLIGLLVPTAGEVRVDGVDVRAEPRRVRERIGYMGQKVSLYQGLSLRENVEFYAGLYGLAGADLERRWGALCGRFDLAEAEREKVESLPAGLRQRAGLALATLHEPRILFLDEPTAGVDVHSRGLFWEVIQEEADAGITVFVTTHFLEETDYCDRVAFIDAGRLVADTTPEALRAAYADGYRVESDAPPAPAALDALRAAGFQPDTARGAGCAWRTRALDAAALDALEQAFGRGGAGRLRIEQPGMTEVFRGLSRAAAAERRREASA